MNMIMIIICMVFGHWCVSGCERIKLLSQKKRKKKRVEEVGLGYKQPTRLPYVPRFFLLKRQYLWPSFSSLVFLLSSHSQPSSSFSFSSFPDSHLYLPQFSLPISVELFSFKPHPHPQ